MEKLQIKMLAMFVAVSAVCTVALVQKGYAGELDDLLGLGEEEVAAEVTTSDNGEAAAGENLEDAVEETVEIVEEVTDDDTNTIVAAEAATSDNAEAAAEPVSEAEEAAPAVEEAVAEEAAPAEPVAAEAVVEEAAPVAAPAAEEPVVDEAAEEVPAEEVPAAAEPVAEAEEPVAEETAPAEEAAPVAEAVVEEPAAEEVAAAAEPVAEPVVEEAAEEAPAEAAEEVAAAAEPVAEPVVEEAAPAVEEVPAAEEAVEEIVVEETAAEEVTEEAVEEEVVEEAAAEEPVIEEAAEEVAEELVAEEPVAEVGEVASAAPAGVEEIAQIAQLEKMRRSALDNHGKESLVKAREAMKNGNYPTAKALYKDAKDYISASPENAEILDEANKGYNESIYRQALVFMNRGDYEEVRKLSKELEDRGDIRYRKLRADAKHLEENPPPPKVVPPTKRWNEEKYRDNKKDVHKRLVRAREYYLTGEYDKSRAELEIILRDNPYEQDAIRMLRSVSDREYDLASEELNSTRAKMIESVRKAWTSRTYGIDIADVGDGGGDTTVEGTQVGASGKTIEEQTEDKMHSIIIPEIQFRAADINDVIDFFETASREYDSQEIPQELRGVNLILKLGEGAQAAAPELESDDPFAAPAAVETSSSGIKPITFRARYISLWDALKMVSEISGLKFRVRGNMVMIMPLNEPEGTMVSRSYTVLPSIEERASSISSALSSTSFKAEDEGSFGGGDDEDYSGGGIDWKQLFQDMGVPWPNGSTITYLPSINKMRVLNTPENLIEFEKALQDLNVTPRQIEIEARFVEVSQLDLESLGFEWLLNDNWEIAHNRNDPSQYIYAGKGSGTRGLRYLSSDVGVNGLDKVADNVLSVSSVLTNPELSFVLHALEQRANTDLLSAPKVVTMNSQEAIIKVVTEWLYPTEYEIRDQDIGSGSDDDSNTVSYPAVEPQSFEMREVGVILQVVPEVSDDGQMIYLQLQPQIISEPTWKDYGFDYPIAISKDMSEPSTVHLKMEQPIFKVRSINTRISIYNGATVVMGGMITEERTSVEDKVPFFGDLPLLGRFFRSTVDKSEKRNLLVFVTARMVDPAGRTLHTETNAGVEPNKAPEPTAAPTSNGPRADEE